MWKPIVKPMDRFTALITAELRIIYENYNFYATVLNLTNLHWTWHPYLGSWDCGIVNCGSNISVVDYLIWNIEMTNYSGRNEDVLSLWLITDGGSQLPCHGRTWYIDPIARKNAKCNIFLPCFIDHLLIAAWIIWTFFPRMSNPGRLTVSPAYDMYSLCLATPDTRLQTVSGLWTAETVSWPDAVS